MQSIFLNNIYALMAEPTGDFLCMGKGHVTRKFTEINK